MKGCWDHNPENRPTAHEIMNCLCEYHYSFEEEKEIIKLAEAKRQEIIKSCQIQRIMNIILNHFIQVAY